MSNADKHRRVALFVGVDDYDDASIPNLSGAVADASALYEFFASRHNQFDTVAVLKNPKSDDVFIKVQELSADLREGDFFMFYFAGHGVVDDNKQKLLCSNTRRGKRSLANEFDLRHVAGEERWSVAVILDACRSRLDTSRALEPRVCERRDLDFYDSLVKSRNPKDASLTILFSCDEGLTAGEVTGRGHGLFTLALLDVLERADTEHYGWRFDQNLSNEIGAAMRRLSDKDSNQRPWIRASGEPPVFFFPSMDIAPLKAWLSRMNAANVILDDTAAECLKALGGTSDKVGAKGIFEAIRFFSNWNREKENKEADVEKVAAVILESLCKAETRIEWRDRPSSHVANPVPSPLSHSLSPEERRRLGAVADGVTIAWRRKNRMARACEAMKSAATEDEALEAIKEAEEAVRDEFVRENPETGIDRGPLNRLEPLFTSQEWNNLWSYVRKSIPDDSQCLCEADRALSRLFRLSTVCCRVLRN